MDETTLAERLGKCCKVPIVPVVLTVYQDGLVPAMELTAGFEIDRTSILRVGKFVLYAGCSQHAWK